VANVPVTAGEPVYIRVAGFILAQGNYTMTVTAAPGTVVTTAYGGDTTDGPTWHRPNERGSGTSGSCGLADEATAVPYEAETFTVGMDGSYAIRNTADGWPFSVLLLYEGAFDPADPCNNLRDIDFDFGEDFLPPGVTSFEWPLTAGTSYTLVVTGTLNEDFGPYTGTIIGPAAVVFPTASEPGADGATWLTATPNPVAGTATLRLSTATAQTVTVALFDITGRRVATLFSGNAFAGQPLEIALDASSLPAGVYVVRATGGDLVLTQRLTVVR
jgi:hypothetical protein